MQLLLLQEFWLQLVLRYETTRPLDAYLEAPQIYDAKEMQMLE